MVLSQYAIELGNAFQLSYARLQVCFGNVAEGVCQWEQPGNLKVCNMGTDSGGGIGR